MIPTKTGGRKVEAPGGECVKAGKNPTYKFLSQVKAR